MLQALWGRSLCIAAFCSRSAGARMGRIAGSALLFAWVTGCSLAAFSLGPLVRVISLSWLGL
eukprot:4319026-Lingulodinium_polyedra.AAC.1